MSTIIHRRASRHLSRAIIETLETRKLLAAPLALDPPARIDRPDYIAPTSASPSFATNPPGHFQYEYTRPKLVYHFDQPVDVQRSDLILTRLNWARSRWRPPTYPQPSAA